MDLTIAKNYSKRLTQKLEDPRWQPKRANIEHARNTIQDLIEKIEKIEKKDVSYENQLRACLRDFHAMASEEIEHIRYERSKTWLEQWERLFRDANNILNREDNSYK